MWSYSFFWGIRGCESPFLEVISDRERALAVRMNYPPQLLSASHVFLSSSRVSFLTSLMS